MVGVSKRVILMFTRARAPSSVRACLPTHSCGHDMLSSPMIFMYLCIRLLCWLWWRNYSHNLVSKLPEKCTLIWFGEVICCHIAGGTPGNGNLSLVDPVSDEEISHVDVLGALAAGCFAILFQ